MKVCFVAIDTTGDDIDMNEVWRVDVIVRDKMDEDEEVKTWLLPVERLAFADPKLLEISGFHDHHSQGVEHMTSKIAGELGTTNLEAFAKAIVKLTRGALMVGDRVAYSEERLRRIVRSVGLAPAWRDGMIDLGSYLAGHLHTSEPVDCDASGLVAYDIVGAERARELYDTALGRRKKVHAVAAGDAS